MKKLLTILALLVVFSIATQNAVQAQTAEALQAIKKQTDVKALNTLQTQFARQAKANKEKAINLAREKGWIIKKELPGGRVMELQGVYPSGKPMYKVTFNINAAQTASTDEVWTGGSMGLDLNGSGMNLGVWDGGGVLTTHQEFGGRVTQQDVPGGSSNHATHVAGTMVASGTDASAKGMAHESSLDAYDWNSDLSEMAAAAANGMLVSNHSYGYSAGWYWDGSEWTWLGDSLISEEEDYKFGFYSDVSQAWDTLANSAPYYLMMKAAGNDRGEGPSTNDTNHEYDGGSDGYDCIAHAALSKNVLTVGAVQDLTTDYTQPSDVTMTYFSTWGPADDGRIKPDITANGYTLYSTSDAGTDQYTTMNGTSMASPSTTGSLILLQEHYFNLYGEHMKAATLKSLVLHTAREAGANPGPDYSYGWGLLNTAEAAQTISEKDQLAFIKEETLNDGNTFSLDVEATGNEPLVATIVWNDPAGTPVSEQLDPADIMLVNDLDINISDGTNTFNPWVLDKDNPSYAATTGNNDVDNVEQVYIESPSAGTYTITINHEGTLDGGSQDFSLVVTGITNNYPVAVLDSIYNIAPTSADADGNITSDGGETVTERGFVYNTTGNPDLSDNVVTSGTGIGTFTASITGLSPSTKYFVRAYATNANGTAYTAEQEFTTGCDAVTSFPFTEDFSDGRLPDCWQNIDNAGDGGVWLFNNPADRSPNTSTASNGFAIIDSDHYGSGVSQNADMITPAMDFSEYDTVRLTFEHYYNDYASEEATVSYSTDDGSTWTDIANWTGADSENAAVFEQELSSELAHQNNVKFKWSYIGSYGWYWIVDDVEIEATKASLAAGFSASPLSGEAPLTVSFTDESTGDIQSWSWDFDGDNVEDSSDPNPSFEYTQAGTYTVSLTVSDGTDSSVETKTDYITVNTPLNADFTASPTSGTAPLSVTFTDGTSPTPSSWEWDFDNDGTIDATSQNPAHTYNEAGEYAVKLIAHQDAYSDTTIKYGYISVKDPNTIYSVADYTGVWSDPNTWVGGTVPTADHDVVIQGTVKLDDNFEARRLYVNSGRILQGGDSYGHTLTLDSLINNGIVQDGGAELYIDLYDYWENNGEMTNSDLQFWGDSHCEIVASHEIATVKLLDGKNGGSITFKTDATLRNTQLYINDVPVYLEGGQLSLIGSGAFLDDVDFRGNGNTLYLTNNAYLYGYTHIWNTQLAGTVEIEGSKPRLKGANVFIKDTLTNHAPYTAMLSADTLYNQGIIVDNPDGGSFKVSVWEHMHNAGTMTNDELRFAGDGEAKISATNEIAVAHIYDENAADSITLITDVTFRNIFVYINDAKVYLDAAQLTLKGANAHLEDVEFHGNGNTLYLTNDAYLNGGGTEIWDTQLTGTTKIQGGGPWLKGPSVFVKDTLVNRAPYSATLNADTLYNQGIVMDNPDGGEFGVNLYTHLHNEGTITNSKITFTDDSDIKISATQEIAAQQMHDSKSAGSISFITNATLRNTHVYVNDVPLYLDAAQLNLLGASASMDAVEFRGNGNTLYLSNNAYLEGYTQIWNTQLTGTTQIEGGYSSFKGSSVFVKDTLVNRAPYSATLNADTLYNQGIVMDNPAGGGLDIDLFTHLRNEGVMTNANVQFQGDSEVTVAATQEIGTGIFTDMMSSGSIEVNTDLLLNNTHIYVNDVPVNLNGSLLQISGSEGRIDDTQVNAQGNSIKLLNGAYLDGSAEITNAHLYGHAIATGGSVWFRDTVHVHDSLTNDPGYNSTLQAENLKNHGIVKNSDAGGKLDIYLHNDFVNNGSADFDDFYIDNETDEAQLINLASGEPVPAFVRMYANKGTGDYQWYKDGTAISGATSSYFDIDTIHYEDFGTYYCATDAGNSREITIDGTILFNAGFEADILTGDAPLTVNFTDLSSGDITSWSWDFDGDGVEDSNEQNPGYTYNQAGDYTVSLTVSDGTNTDTETKDAYIKVTEPTATVEGMVTDATSGDPIEGATVTIDGISDVTDSNGNYSISGISLGSLDADFRSDVQSGIAPLSVQFYDESELYAQTLTAQATGYINYINEQVIVDQEGTFTQNISMSPEMGDAQFRMVLNWGASPTDLDAHLKTPEIDGYTHHVYYGDKGSATAAPYATLDHDVTEGYGPETMSIYDLFTGTYHFYIHRYSSTGDLTTSGAMITVYHADGSSQSIQVPSSGTGEYWHVCDIDGGTGNVHVVNQIIEDAPYISKKATAKSTKNSVVSWQWDFGDGTTSSAQNPQHEYTNPGTYTVSLEVTDENDSIDAEIKTNLITVEEQLLADFEADAVEGQAPFTVNFSDLSTGNVTTWSWDFDDDGNEDAAVQNPSYTYQEQGIYSVTLTVSDGTNTASETFTDYITVNPATGIAEAEGLQFKIYPNPAREAFFISLQQGGKDVVAELLSITGKRVMIRPVAQAGSKDPREFRVDHLQPGVYLLKLTSDEGISVQKLIIE